MVRVAIGIPTYNGFWRVDNLLKSIYLRTPLLTSGDVSIVLVDDGSPVVQSTRETFERWRDRLPIQLVEHGENRGISAAWNTASRACAAERVVLINDDVIVSGGWLEALLYALDYSPGVGVVGANWHAFVADDVAQLLASPESDVGVCPRDPISKAQASERRQLEDTNPGRVMCPGGQLFAFRRSEFDAVGGFDEQMKSFYEESSFGTEMAARGKIGVQLAWPFNWHMWSATFSASPELKASERLAVSRARYRQRWAVPDSFAQGAEFDYTNPKYLGNVGDVEVAFLRRTGPARGILRQDGAFIEAA